MRKLSLLFFALLIFASPALSQESSPFRAKLLENAKTAEKLLQEGKVDSALELHTDSIEVCHKVSKMLAEEGEELDCLVFAMVYFQRARVLSAIRDYPNAKKDIDNASRFITKTESTDETIAFKVYIDELKKMILKGSESGRTKMTDEEAKAFFSSSTYKRGFKEGEKLEKEGFGKKTPENTSSASSKSKEKLELDEQAVSRIKESKEYKEAVKQGKESLAKKSAEMEVQKRVVSSIMERQEAERREIERRMKVQEDRNTPTAFLRLSVGIVVIIIFGIFIHTVRKNNKEE